MICAKRYTYATLITFGRLLCVFPIIYAIATQQWIVAFSFFVAAAATDGLDGYIARMFNECTFFGAALDACVDKIMIVATLFSLVFFNHTTFSIPSWFLTIISIKEILQLGGLIYIYFYIYHFEIKPLLLGKLTMVLYVILIGFFLYAHIKKVSLYWIQYCCVVVALVACASFCEYFFVAYRYMNQYALKNEK